MATRFEIVIFGPQPSRLRAAGEEAINEIEISWINAHAYSEPVRVEPRLFELLKLSVRLAELTDQAFDITVAPLLKVWGMTDKQLDIPSKNDLNGAMRSTGSDKLILDESAFTVSFARDGVRIDLGAIGKGYAVDQAAGILLEGGVTSAIIHGGTSSIHAIGSPPDQSSWNIGIGPLTHGLPADAYEGPNWHKWSSAPSLVSLHDCSLSVSAVHGKSFAKNGIEFGHVIDPRTGEPIKHRGLAAVAGPSATLCDALSTALLVLCKKWLPILESRFPEYAGFWTCSLPLDSNTLTA